MLWVGLYLWGYGLLFWFLGLLWFLGVMGEKRALAEKEKKILSPDYSPEYEKDFAEDMRDKLVPLVILGYCYYLNYLSGGIRFDYTILR